MKQEVYPESIKRGKMTIDAHKIVRVCDKGMSHGRLMQAIRLIVVIHHVGEERLHQQARAAQAIVARLCGNALGLLEALAGPWRIAFQTCGGRVQQAGFLVSTALLDVNANAQTPPAELRGTAFFRGELMETGYVFSPDATNSCEVFPSRRRSLTSSD